MRRSLTLVTAPANEPITLSEAKSWLRIDDASDDALVSQLISAARSAAEEYLRRSLITQTLKLTIDLAGTALDNFLGEGTYQMPVSALYGCVAPTIELPKGPVQSISSVMTYDLTNTGTTFAPSNYFIDTAGQRFILTYGSIWPANLRQQAAVEINYVAGYGATASDVPQPIKTGMLIHIASLYEQRGQCADAMDLPPGTKQLFNQYRIIGDRRG